MTDEDQPAVLPTFDIDLGEEADYDPISDEQLREKLLVRLSEIEPALAASLGITGCNVRERLWEAAKTGEIEKHENGQEWAELIGTLTDLGGG